MFLVVLAGILLFAGGLALRMWTEKREMYRRNEAGVQEHESYGSLVKDRAIDGTARLIGKIAMFVGFCVLVFVGFTSFMS